MQEVIAPPNLKENLGSKVSLTFETKRLLSEIEKDIASLDWKLAGLASLDAVPQIAAPARHLLSAGGKRVRPLLICLLGRALEVPFEALSLCATAAEFVHTATLLHDDVLDEAKTRRGRIAAHLKYNTHTAILSGDALLCKALADIATLEDPEVLRRLALTIKELVEGECLQADLQSQVHKEIEIVLEVLRKKTASLFAWCGWVTGHRAKRFSYELASFGKHLGLAFQLLDDLLDWEGKATGKPQFQDLREGKLNSVGVVLVGKSKQAEALLKTAFETLNSDKEVENAEALGQQLKSLFEYEESIAWVRDRAQKENAFALAQLELLPDSQWKTVVKQISQELLQRMS